MPSPGNSIPRIVLADGSRWGLITDDPQIALLIPHLVEVMGLPLLKGNVCNWIVLQSAPLLQAEHFRISASPQSNQNQIQCSIRITQKQADDLICALVAILSILGHHAQRHGGMLLHSALAELDGRGVALAANGGVGKSTASRRLPPPWRSLCDDTLLILKDHQGNYWAHPFPTSSQFVDDGTGGMWDCNHAVSLKALFFLKQALEEHAEQLAKHEAVGRLVNSAQQASGPVERGLDEDQRRTQRITRFDSICALAMAVPAFDLHLSLHGDFWLEMARVLEI